MATSYCAIDRKIPKRLGSRTIDDVYNCGTILVNFELQPHLSGNLVELRPLHPDDWRDLLQVAADPLLWEQHPDRERFKEEVFRAFFLEALASGGALTVLDRKTQAIIGSSRFFGYDALKSEIEIGWTFVARTHWGGRYNGEMKSLMLDHAFKFVNRVIFLIGPENFRSRRAIEKIGAVLTHNRKTVSLHGKPVELLEYEIQRSNWASPA